MAREEGSRAGDRRRRETLEPGGEVGETREVGRAGAEELAGRPPATKVVVHPPRKPGEQPRSGSDQE